MKQGSLPKNIAYFFEKMELVGEVAEKREVTLKYALELLPTALETYFELKPPQPNHLIEWEGLSIEKLRDICRSDKKFKGYSTRKRKQELLAFMASREDEKIEVVEIGGGSFII